jgi:hypothetical protein
MAIRRGGEKTNSDDTHKTMTYNTSTDKGALSRSISAASFWAPIWVRPESEWLEHAPFGFWLIEALRPRTVVELGTHSGYSLAVFCQAVQALDLDCRCYGVDQWQSDTHKAMNGEEIFRAISDHNEAHYKSFSTLIRSDFDTACTHFEDGSIDLLHIDGCYSYQAVLAEYAAWRPRMSKSGVILFHDTNVRGPGFGVARLWQDLTHDHRHFEFLHGCGLGVLGVGECCPEPLEYLFAHMREPEATKHIRLAYSRLGSIISVQTRCKDPQALLHLRDLQHAQDQARLSEMELELRRQSARQAYLSANASLRAAKFEQAIEQLREQAKAQQDAFLNSTSWRVTAPLRTVMRLLRREEASNGGK